MIDKNKIIDGLPDAILWHDEQPYIHAMGLMQYIYGMLESLDYYPAEDSDEREIVQIVQHVFADFSISIGNSIERSYVDRTLSRLEESL